MIGTLAQAGGRILAGWTLKNFIIAIIIIAAAIAILIVALNYFEIQIPPWVVKIFWIVVVAFVAIFAIRLLFSM